MGTLGEGDELEAAIWYNSEKPDEEQNARQGIYRIFLHTEEQQNVRLGPVEFTIMRFGDPRVPEPPKHFSGSPLLMVGHAVVDKVFAAKLGGNAGFSKDLTEEDLATLRKVTQEKYLATHPGAAPLTDLQLDRIIDTVGLETALKSLPSN